MSKIGRMYNAVISAAYDRRFVSKNPKNLKTPIDLKFHESLVKTTGPSTNNPIQAAKSFFKAYKMNSLRLLREEVINSQFRNPSIFSKALKFLAKAIR
ncbi:MAG: hypothetical protein V8S20_01265 [Candidatus Gastranaerophilaceae bacterium]